MPMAPVTRLPNHHRHHRHRRNPPRPARQRQPHPNAPTISSRASPCFRHCAPLPGVGRNNTTEPRGAGEFEPLIRDRRVKKRRCPGRPVVRAATGKAGTAANATAPTRVHFFGAPSAFVVASSAFFAGASAFFAEACAFFAGAPAFLGFSDVTVSFWSATIDRFSEM